MKIALVHDWLIDMQDEERCLEALCELFPSASLYTLFARRERLSGTINDMAITTSAFQRWPRIASCFRYCLPLFPVAIEQFDFSGCDLVISSSRHVAKGVITSSDTLHICYCHAPMPFVWHEHGAPRRPAARMIRAACAPYLRLWDVVSAQRVDHFVAASGAAARQIRKYYRRDAVVIDASQDRTLFKQQMQEYVAQCVAAFQATREKERASRRRYDRPPRTASRPPASSPHQAR